MKRYWLLGSIVIGCVVLLTAAVWAVSPWEKRQIDNFGASTLKGLEAVAVEVRVARDRPETLSLLKQEELQGEVEMALQRGGLKIRRPTPGVGLYIVVAKVATPGGREARTCAIHVQSSLLQVVHLSRDTTIRAESQTWPSVGHGRFGVVNYGMAKSLIRQTVKDHTQDFISDWKAANQ